MNETLSTPENGNPSDSDASDSQTEEESVAQATRLTAPLIYEVIRRDGEEELLRPFSSLVWSGLAAGMLISFSVLAEAALRAHLPDRPGSFLIENLGYSLGFVVVIMGRMQLFTENTITTVLPVIAHLTPRSIAAMARLWGVVLTANVTGAMVAGWFLTMPELLAPEMAVAIQSLSTHATSMGIWPSFLRAVPAGIIVASLVWMIPSAQGGGAFAIIVAFTWLLAVGDFTHIIAGSVEMWYLLWLGELDPWRAATGFFAPVLIGNIIGGTAIFTLLAWGQVRNEVDHGS